MNKSIDLTGKKFGRLTVVSRTNRDKTRHICWLCRCDCGKEKIVRGSRLQNGETQSCRCFQIEKATKHGHYTANEQSKEYRAWNHMIQRCTNPNYQYYRNYGGRGIGVCEEWLKFPNFLRDMGKSPDDGHSLERKNNDKGYCKENCCWATSKQQGRNKRNNIFTMYNGEKRLIIELAEQFGISYAVLKSRINRGWHTRRALTAPVGKYTRKSR